MRVLHQVLVVTKLFPTAACTVLEKRKIDVQKEIKVSNGLSIFAHKMGYMAGNLYDPHVANSTACYWKEGQRVDLTDGNGSAVARSIFVTDRHVYVAGMMDDQAVYWKDGVVTALTTGGTNSMAHAIFVQGEDVHVGGYQDGHPGRLEK